MKRQNLRIAHPLRISVQWYDRVPEPPRTQTYEGEIVGWRDTQVIVRVPDYAVIRFWKHSGLEVGNPDHARRGFMVDFLELEGSIAAKPEAGLAVPLAIDTDA